MGAKESGVRPQSGAVDPGGAPRGPVLVVDDDPALRKVLQRLLRSRGYTVLLANDGQQAVDICQALDGELALVVMDFVMPVMDGATAFRTLRQRYPELAVLFMSGSATHEVAGLVPDGARGFVAKPFSEGDLLDAVARAQRSAA